MAITSFDRIWVGTSAEAAFGQSLGLTMRYRVISDDGEMDDVLTVLSDPRCPVRGNSVTIRGQQWYVNRVNVEPPDESNRIVYHVTSELLDQLPSDASDSFDSPPGGAKPNPTDDEPVIEFDSGSSFEPIDYDVVTGKDIANSAGDLFEPRPKRFVAAPTVTVTINQLTNPWPVCREYVGTVNDKEWNGAEEKTVMLRSLRARFRVRNGIQFWQCTYTFEFKKYGWRISLADVGKNQLVERDGVTYKEPISIGGYPTQEDQLLDGKGSYLTPDALKAEGKFGQARRRIFDIQKPANFDNLNITLPA